MQGAADRSGGAIALATLQVRRVGMRTAKHMVELSYSRQSCSSAGRHSVRGPPISELTAIDQSIPIRVDFTEADLHLLDRHACLQPFEQQSEFAEIDAPVVVAVSSGEF